MTTLTDTLPILDEAVPALPAKVEDVARAGDAFADVARKALRGIDELREEAEGLVAKVAEALEALRDRARDAAQRLEAEGQELRTEAEQATTDVQTERGQLHDAGEQLVAAIEALENAATNGGESISQAHHESRAAVAHWGEESQEREAAVQGDAGLMTAALSTVAQAADEGQTRVNEGVTALQEAMARLLLETQGRLQQTANKLDELAGEQETAVTAVASQLSDGRREISGGVSEAMRTAWEQDLDPAVESATSTLQDLSSDLLDVDDQTTSRRQTLDGHVKTAGASLPPIAAGLEQAKVGAQKVGIPWQ